MNYQPATGNKNQESNKKQKKGQQKRGWEDSKRARNWQPPPDSKKKKPAPVPESHRAENTKPVSWEQGRSRAVALDLRASVCKLLWVHYDELPRCNRVPENLKEIYRMDWGRFNETDIQQVIEAQVRFL